MHGGKAECTKAGIHGWKAGRLKGKAGRLMGKACFNLRLGRRLKAARHGRDHAYPCRSTLHTARR